MSSFAQQYGIRLYYEYDSISCQEFRQLLCGLNGDTPLGYVVQIRSETDFKKIKEMSKKEKEIRYEWNQFKLNHKKQEKIELKKENISKIFSSMFGR